MPELSYYFLKTFDKSRLCKELDFFALVDVITNKRQNSNSNIGKMKTAIAILSCLLLLQGKTAAQANYAVRTIEGIVKASGTNAPIHLANVYVIGASVGTTTDQQGKYKILISDSLLNQKHISIVSHCPGYFTDTFVLMPAQRPAELNFALLERHSILITDNNHPVIGYTVDASTHQPIEGVMIKSNGLKNLMFSKDNGTFALTFSEIRKNKKRTITFSKKGFSKRQIKVDTSHWVGEVIIKLAEKKR